MKRSKRFEKLEQRPIMKDGFAYEWEDVGLITMESQYDPEPSIEVKDGIITMMDGIKREDFDSLDKFIADYGIIVENAEEAMAMDSLEIARMMVDINVPREEIVKICCSCTPAKITEIVSKLNVVEMMMAQMKMRARKTPANQAHATNMDDNPVLIAADAAEEATRGFAELETTCAVARYAPFNAIALMVGAQTGRAGVLIQCSMEEATELELGMRGFTSYAETLSVYGTERVLIDGGDTAYSKAFLASAYASRGIKIRFTSGTGSEVLMGDAEGKSMLYLEARCLFLTRACGVQGTQNGSINAIPLVAALPNGFRAITAENLIAGMINLEVAAGNDTAFSHSDFRRGAKLVMTLMPGADYVTSGYGGIPNFDNVFAGSNEDCDDYEDWYTLQRDMKVDGGIQPAREEDVLAARSRAAKAMQTIFAGLGLPVITDEEVEAATYAYSYKDMPARNKAEDCKAATEMMAKGTTIVDVIKILHENGYQDIAENLMNLLKQRVIGDYLHTSSFFDKDYKVYSAVNDRNDYAGPGTGYRISDERWEQLKEKFYALKPQEMGESDGSNKLDIKEIGPSAQGTDAKEIVIALSPAFGDRLTETIHEIDLKAVLKEICAGIEEEGMTYRFITVKNSTDLAIIASQGSKIAGSGICIGLQSRGTTVIHQRDLVPLDNLELFPQSPLITIEMYRSIGKNAAKYGKGENPEPIEAVNDFMVPSEFLIKSTLMHFQEGKAMDLDAKPIDIEVALY